MPSTGSASQHQNSKNGSDEAPEKEQPFSDLAAQFGGQTSMHGVGKVLDGAKCTLLHCLWALVVCGAVTGASFQIYKQTDKFLQKPIRTLIRVDNNGFEFPDVTFCDQLANQLDIVGHNLPENWSNQIDNSTEMTNASAEEVLQKQNEAYQTIERLAYLTIDRILKTFQQTSNNSAWKTSYVLPNVQQHYSRMSNRYPWAMDKVIYCNYKGKKCTAKDFDTRFSTSAGNCYKFRPKERGNSDQNSLELMILSPKIHCSCGVANEFARPLDVKVLATGTPIALKAVPKDSSPTNTDNSIGLAVGQATTVQLIQQNLQFVHNHPRRMCMPQHQMAVYGDRNKRRYNYEQELCKLSVYVQHVAKTCKCLPDWETVMPNEEFLEMDISRQKIIEYYNDYNYCSNMNDFLWKESRTDYLKKLNNNETSIKQVLADVNNGTNKNFVERLHCFWMQSYKYNPNNGKSLDTTSMFKKCIDPCSYIHYSKTVSQNEWPMSINFRRRGSRAQIGKLVGYIDQYYQEYGEEERTTMKTKLQMTQLLKFHGICNDSTRFDSCKHEETFDEENCTKLAEIIRNNMLWVSISPGMTNTMTFEEQVYYLFWDWLSDVGGTLGLWVGCSLITVVEYGEFFVTTLSLLCAKMTKRHKQRKKTDSYGVEQGVKFEENDIAL